MPEELDFKIERQRIPQAVAEYMAPRILVYLSTFLSREPTDPVIKVLMEEALAQVITLALEIEATATPPKYLPGTSEN
jgi:hypothetical protein